RAPVGCDRRRKEPSEGAVRAVRAGAVVEGRALFRTPRTVRSGEYATRGEQPVTVGSVSAVREANLGLVLRTVRELAPCSRAAVASATGLNKTTVSSLVADLMARGLVRETGLSSRQRVGRPGVLLSLDDTSLAAIGLEVNVDYLALVAVDLLDRELLNVHIPFDARAAGAQASVQQIATALRELALDPVLAERRIIGVGVAIPGLIDAPS